MKKLIFSMLTLALILALVPAGMAKKPAPKLDCTIEYWWMPGWAGVISGDIEGLIIWLPGGYFRVAGQTSHYGGERSFEIYDLDTGDLLMVGGDSHGSTTVRHGRDSIWRSSGTILEAYGPYEDWVGRNVHQEGHFTWEAPGVPLKGYGTVRVN